MWKAFMMGYGDVWGAFICVWTRNADKALFSVIGKNGVVAQETLEGANGGAEAFPVVKMSVVGYSVVQSAFSKVGEYIIVDSFSYM